METDILQSYDVWSSSFSGVEICDSTNSDETKRAVITIPLMHVGANKKGLFWTASLLKEIAHLFENVTFRYDLEGQEGSSHTVNKLSSPHFDVGWTYNGEEGAWYDSKTKTLWVKGEVTHPTVLEKLERSTSDGKREVNFASMGVIVEKANCSICGNEYGSCEHERNQQYDGETCYKVPIKCSKALHVALTNDAADGEAEIRDCIFQELSIRNEYNSRKSKPGEDQITPNYAVDEITNRQEGKNIGEGKNMGNEQNTKSMYRGNFQPPQGNNFQQNSSQANPNNMQNNQMPGGMAPGAPQTAQPGPTISPDLILKELAERIKTIEQKMSNNTLTQNNTNTGQLQDNAMSEGTAELLNVSPQDQSTQDNMGTTTQFEAQKASENKQQTEENMGKTDGQVSNEKVPVNPKAVEVQDPNMVPNANVDPMTQVMEILQQILARLPGVNTETQDVGELENATKEKAKESTGEDGMQGHMSPGEPAADKEDEGNVKNKANMNKPGEVATADDEKEKAPVEDKKPDVNTADLKKEMADMQTELKALKGRLELQDNNVPEFGGVNTATGNADINASQRAEKFGDFGKWDSVFNGVGSAAKFGGN